MPEMSATNARVRGLMILLLGLPLLGFGLWLYAVTLGRPLPSWLPDALREAPKLDVPDGTSERARLATASGLASLFLMGFGATAGLQGLAMLVTGRRSRFLLVVMAVLALIIAGTGYRLVTGDLN